MEMNPNPILTLNHLQWPVPCKTWDSSSSSCSGNFPGSSPPLLAPAEEEGKAGGEKGGKEGGEWREKKKEGGDKMHSKELNSGNIILALYTGVTTREETEKEKKKKQNKIKKQTAKRA